MAVLDILHYPDDRLRTEAQPVGQVDDDIRTLVDDMLETMYAARGVGLAAPQVDRHIRMLVMDTSENQDEPLALINPEIVEAEGEQDGEEGCLSLPGVYEPVVRAAEVTARFRDREGREREERFSGLAARCVQHELDHLEGKLFVDYLSKLKRSRLRKKMEKDKRLQAAPA
ncbi:peptide deformylase [Thiohalorhabdus methylotrophus]|uniref:Peptide deformylase n=1 Tax=Thiohalorhabdus methylotrophus TaxID=3242694 RepID=A0ABV4TPM7_9GAMM